MNNKTIDLFSGAGGLTTGFHLAGFETLCAIDSNKKALATYQHNYPNTKVIHQDIREVNPSELRHNLGLEREQLKAIIGGPPCQGFSRNIPAEYRYIDDPQNQLYKSFLDFVKEFKPLYVIMENVPEILTAYKGLFKYQITNQLESLGYKVISSSLNAAKYGVPQTRSRAFFIASLERLIVLPNPTHNDDDIKVKSKNKELYYQTNLLKSNSSPIVTVKDAIGDLPELNAGQKYDEDRYPSDPQTSYQTLIRHNSSKITNHIARALSSIQMSRVKLLKEGQDARNLPPELAPKKHYSGAYGRLYWDQPAKTITRWVFHPGSGRFFHPTQDRTITIREAARLHSYPDTFHFLGTYTEMASQIGESVPPLLAKTIAECII
ncbi:DNA cytosine methyltransferase [Dolichospermum sp. ST_con]|nr:DNA cytosine methyltransferase [Dolichospermum sp. ST_con]MDD1420834.1 DNA cytosine methyltransferase [Dolichospermum sp. ST_sed1]MDD1423052.1 DNA cytosine methyltransferase [Dolichospermum sp. ST_sed9]MDD1432488.1 DNA cytosine methyltransferase [Dolichospermum sp. ST_sed6]MDD1436321.1 DNA cytosine methyltransferase [Dolichospermum sp. ST_sed10]MDD1442392.1 DNA cytosine methyltransferase [Dolichospermum sp. ST_sed3]MDD1447849.1 DNA cytosine methyltransferase [Dolichospermum sp. ST_sed8]MD